MGTGTGVDHEGGRDADLVTLADRKRIRGGAVAPGLSQIHLAEQRLESWV